MQPKKFKTDILKMRLIFLLCTLNSLFAADHFMFEVTEELTTLSADSSIQYLWENDNWEPFKKRIYLHNDFGQVTEESRYSFSIDTWFNEGRNILTYDSQNKLVEWLNQEGYVFSWQNSWLDQYAYDGNGALSEKTHQVDEADSWQLLERSSYDYDGDSLLAEEIIQANVVGNWLNDYRRTYTYLSEGKIANSLGQVWDYDGGFWRNDSLKSYSYHEGNLSQLLVQTWEGEVWINQHQKTFSYDMDDHLIEEVMKGWFWDQWMEIARHLHDFDLSGYLMMTTYQDWDYDETSWYDKDRVLFQYDAYGNLVESLTQYLASETNSWTNEYLDTWYYPIPSALETEQPRVLALEQNFPNPFNPSTSIRFHLPENSEVNLIIYDVLGQEIITLYTGEKSAGSHELSWGGINHGGNPVSTGVYFCRLQITDPSTGRTGDFNKTIKMVYLK